MELLNRTPSFLVLVLAGVLLLGIFYGGAFSTKAYENLAYGYSFNYPAHYEVREYTPEHVALGRSRGDIFEPHVEIVLAQSGEESPAESYWAFLIERSQLNCAANGPDETLNCNGVVEHRPFYTAFKVEGEELYLRLVRRRLSSGAVTTQRFGPVYAFNLSKNVPSSRFAALLIYRSWQMLWQRAAAGLAVTIADSLKITSLPSRD